MLKDLIASALMPLLRHLSSASNRRHRAAEEQIFEDLSQLISVSAFDRRPGPDLMPDTSASSVVARRGTNHVWPRVLPFALYMAFLAIAPAVADAFPGLDERWLYGVKVGLVAGALIFLWRQFEELSSSCLPVRDFLWALVAGAAVFVAWINLDLPWVSFMSNDSAAGYDPRAADGRIDWALAALRIAGAALVVPVMEELFWRSLVMRWIDQQDFLAAEPRSIGLRALLASSVVFGFEHHLWLAGIVAGLVYGELYRRSGNLWLPIVAHGITNGALGIWVLWSGQWQFW
jgi:CAAX prenyl protease-like protein